MPRIRMLSTHGGSLGPLLPALEYHVGQEYDLPDTPGCLADVFVREGWAELVAEAPPEVKVEAQPAALAPSRSDPHGLAKMDAPPDPPRPRGRPRRH